MYGLVNCAIQDLITTKFDEETWDRIRRRAGVTHSRFVSMGVYPDEITYQLVGAASEELHLSPAQVLETFGEWWMLYSSRHGYGALMDTFGRDFVEFLANLNDLHDRLRAIFPRYKPPHLTIEVLAEDRLLLHYRSHRKGLAPFVVGLLRGLAYRFHTTITVVQVETRDAGADHDVFEIVHHRDETHTGVAS